MGESTADIMGTGAVRREGHVVSRRWPPPGRTSLVLGPLFLTLGTGGGALVGQACGAGPDLARWSAAMEWLARSPAPAHVDVWFGRRSLGRVDGPVLRERAETRRGVGLDALPEPPSRTASTGLQPWQTVGPDLAVLIDPGVAPSHCIRTVEGEDGQLGLAFVPRDSSGPVVSGTVWWDPQAGRVREIEYELVGVPGVDDGVLGGRVELVDGVEGRWLPVRWRVVGEGVDRQGRRGLVETFGVVTEARDDAGRVVYVDPSTTVLHGTVFDSTTGGPLAGAVVALAGTGTWSSTDSRGEYFLAGLWDRSYRLVFGHPRLDSLGFVAVPKVVVLERGTTTLRHLTVPSLESIYVSRCGPEAAGGRMLFGVVRDRITGRPVPGADVNVGWEVIPPDLQEFAAEDRSAAVVSDSLGTFSVCAAPLGRVLYVHAETGSGSSPVVEVAFDTTRVSGDSTTGGETVHRIDLDLTPADRLAGRISGLVTNVRTGAPIQGAIIEVVGTSLRAQSDVRGTFVIHQVPAGSHRLVVRRIGYRSIRHSIRTVDGEDVVIGGQTLAMAPGAMELAPIVVEAKGGIAGQRHLADFFARRAAGFGHFVTREEFEGWNPAVTSDVIRHVGGMRVVANPNYGVNGDRRRVLLGSGRAIGGRECPVLYFVDGLFIGTSADQDARINTFIPLVSIEAIEVYSGMSQLPAEFVRAGAECGAIVVWTR